jgi:hypothetical protein
MKILRGKDLSKVNPSFQKSVIESWLKGEDVPHSVIFLSETKINKSDIKAVKRVVLDDYNRLVKEYGEQVYRDKKYNGNSLESNANTSMEVALACYQIKEKEKKKFYKDILYYAKTTYFPTNFI